MNWLRHLWAHRNYFWVLVALLVLATLCLAMLAPAARAEGTINISPGPWVMCGAPNDVAKLRGPNDHVIMKGLWFPENWPTTVYAGRDGKFSISIRLEDGRECVTTIGTDLETFRLGEPL